jgi:2-dehydro-3-deoxygluconokinase
MEQGFGSRASKVIYNRKNAVVNTLDIKELDLDNIFNNASWFHVSGISLAISNNSKKVAIELAKEAKRRNLKVSFDFNYRSKLWNSIEEARPYFKKVIPYVDVLFANHFDIQEILEVSLDNACEDIITKKIELSKKLISQTKISYIFGTDRVVHTASDNSLSSYCVGKEEEYKSEGPIRFSIYDRIGGGDAFASGVIHGLIKNFKDTEYALKFGLATSILEHTLYGDVSTLSESEVEEFIKTNGNASIQR